MHLIACFSYSALSVMLKRTIMPQALNKSNQNMVYVRHQLRCYFWESFETMCNYILLPAFDAYALFS